MSQEQSLGLSDLSSRQGQGLGLGAEGTDIKS